MAKGVKAKFELGVNTIVDSVMVPDGFGRVCDGLELRSGAARPWQLPSIFRPVTDPTINCIWEYRGLWFESELHRTYHGEYIQGLPVVYFTEEGIHADGSEASAPQQIVNGTQVRLGIQRPLASPGVSQNQPSWPTLLQASVTGSGGISLNVASYRVAAIVNGAILTPGDSVLTVLPVVAGVVTPSSITLTWRPVPNAEGYAIFGRTEGSERLITKLGIMTTWVDDGTIGEDSVLVSQYVVSHDYQYVYTYYRNIEGIEDESGPSPLSAAISGSVTPIITRQPLYDGIFDQAGTVTYSFSAVAPTLSATLSISTAYTSTIHYYRYSSSSDTTMYGTATAHGFTSGQAGRVSIADPYTSGYIVPTDQIITVPYALMTPIISSPVYTSGGSLTGAHSYQFTAVRAAQSYTSGNPPQTLAATVAVTMPVGSGTVGFNFSSITSGTDAILIYRDGTPIYMAPTSGASAVSAFVDDGSYPILVGSGINLLAGCSVPTSNETATRCFSIQGNYPLHGPIFSGPGVMSWVPLAHFNLSLSDVTFAGTTDLTGFTPVAGDIVFFDGLTTLTNLNGMRTVMAWDSTLKVLTVTAYATSTLLTLTDTTGSMIWTPSNGHYSGWRIYRVGDTAEFLQVADLSMNQVSFTDQVGTDNLGIAIPTQYVENGLEVVFDWAPKQAKRMVNHYGMRFAIVDNLVRWTPTNLPNAWPDVFFAAFPSHPVALAPFKSMLMVLCQDGLYGIAGNTPSTLTTVGPLSNLGCIAPFSVQASNYGIMWLAKPGVCISQDGVSAMCLTADRVSGRYFYAPSTGYDTPSVHVGDDWYMPASQSTQFAESMSQERIDKSFYPVTQVSADLPVNAEMTDIHSYYWNDRYCLFAQGSSKHARMGIITIDMNSRGLASGYGMTMTASGLSHASTGLPITTIPIKPIDVHVSMGGDCYMLLRPYVAPPINITVTVTITSVAITSPV
jgi:hypothetical protein